MTQQFNPNMEEIFRSRKKQEVFERKFHTVTVWISYWYVWGEGDRVIVSQACIVTLRVTNGADCGFGEPSA
ncbi:hypothetical protein [Pseudomonas viridiflava]|uniref:hypothetical protein n=1 Tax=Pseudomonas viridiflava TaxID=33069 RepID=UPI0013CE8963|nr:hypothetical protein [Pseudomonas viridiflava]MEE4224351.1 hypothetical protein [Pseudomonas viridiflava]